MSMTEMKTIRKEREGQVEFSLRESTVPVNVEELPPINGNLVFYNGVFYHSQKAAEKAL